MPHCATKMQVRLSKEALKLVRLEQARLRKFTGMDARKVSVSYTASRMIVLACANGIAGGGK